MDLELEKTVKRYNKQQDRLEEDYGWSATVEASAITRNYIGPLLDQLPSFLVAKDKTEEGLIELLKDLPKETLALCCLSAGLNVVGREKYISFSSALSAIGADIEAECYAKSLMDHDAQMASKLERLAKSRHANLKYRRRAVKTIARKNKFVVENWSKKQQKVAGKWAVNLLLEALPEVFTLEKDGNKRRLIITQDAFHLADEAIKQAIHMYPVYLPSKAKPRPWTDWNNGGPRDSRFQHRATVLRSTHSETAAYVRSAIAKGTMQPAIDALNIIQDVGWRINKPILELMAWCIEHTVSVSSLPRATDIELPHRAKLWDNMTEKEQKAWKIRARKIKAQNRGLSSQRVLLTEDMETANYLSEGVFYTPCNMDWRGRVYPLTHFNFQREDRVRALFEFASGVPMNADGLYWLKVHVANTGDFVKMSKRSFDERVAWVDGHMSWIVKVAKDARNHQWWKNADKPFQFVAACMELVNAIENPQHITHLPVAFDGSCSGLQHLSAMTKAAEGSLVNLTHSDKPQDVYNIVAERVTNNLNMVLKNPQSSRTEQELAKLCLEYGVTRSVVKRNVMTYGYSSQKFGMGAQLREDLMDPLALEVLASERNFHPFGDDEGWKASVFLSSHIFDAIEEIVKKPAEAMGFLRQLAKALAHENKVVVWLTPVGVPWINRYHDATTQRVCLWLSDKGTKIPFNVSVPNGWQKQVNKTRAANGIAPNFVHALDASHLMMTVNSLNEKGITDIALVHDSFGVHAPNASMLRDVLRSEFVRLYTEYDPLNDILDSNKDRVSNPSRLPRPVVKGPLDIKEVLNAEYAFS